MESGDVVNGADDQVKLLQQWLGEVRLSGVDKVVRAKFLRVLRLAGATREGVYLRTQSFCKQDAIVALHTSTSN